MTVQIFYFLKGEPMVTFCLIDACFILPNSSHMKSKTDFLYSQPKREGRKGNSRGRGGGEIESLIAFEYKKLPKSLLEEVALNSHQL